MSIFNQLSLNGLVPVIKIEDAENAVPLCRALMDGGLPVAEITFRTAAAEQAIRNVHEALPDVLLGAGTVLTVDQVRAAVAAGATYIVSPGLNPAVVSYCVEHDIPILPGCANPSDIETALTFGIKTVKFFPAEALGGLPLIKAMSAPYGEVTFVPTGGVTEQNAAAYLAFDKVKAVGGSWMVPADAINQKDWARIESLTRAAVDKLLAFEVAHIGINGASRAQAVADAKRLCALFGWPVREGDGSAFSGRFVEWLYEEGRGGNGQIAVATPNVDRARWHLERKGVSFDAASAVVKGASTLSIYLADEIAGFAFRLVKKG